MKTSLFGAMALLLSCGLALAQPAPGKSEAEMLFDKCRAAYSELKTYRGTTKTMNLSLVDGVPSILSGSAKITFERPTLLRVEGKLADGGNFSIVANAHGNWFRWPLENEGAWVQTTSLGRAIYAMTGVAASAPTTVPLLLTLPLNPRLFRSSEEAKLDGEEQIDGEMCHKVTARAPTETVTWWINKKTFMLRRIVGYTSEEQSAAQLEKIRKLTDAADKAAGREPGPNSNMRLVSRVEDFEIEAVNEPIDEKLFETPTPK